MLVQPEPVLTQIIDRLFPHQGTKSSPGQNGCHFADDSFKCIFMNEKCLISIQISLKFVPEGPIDKKAALVQVMAWRWTVDKPLSEPMLYPGPSTGRLRFG